MPRENSLASIVREMEDDIDRLTECMKLIAFDPSSPEKWLQLEISLRCWLDTCDGGHITAEYIDDNLERILGMSFIQPVFHLSKMYPGELYARGSILLARALWVRIVTAIERAEIVSQIRRASSVEPRIGSPVLHCGGIHHGALSPTPKCK